jgi:hypothetical protein
LFEEDSMNKKALEAIILAQIASDGGKGIKDLLWEIAGVDGTASDAFKRKAWAAFNKGYSCKDSFLEEACQIVARHHDDDLRFFVTEDQQRVAKYIVYFDVRIHNVRWQASFHSFSKSWGKWVKSSAPSRGHWDHKDSRATCSALHAMLIERQPR